MAVKKSGLGKGIGAIFTENSVEDIANDISPVKVKLIDIEPNREQPRKQFDEAALSELADSIAKHGVIQPLLVRPMPDGGYQLVAGERRWRASREAGLSEVPVANGYKELSDKFGYTQEQIAEIVGKSRPSIANSLRLLNLPEDVQKMVSAGSISMGHARAVLALEDDKKKSELAGLVIANDLSVRETERIARNMAKEAPAAGRPKKRNPYYDEAELALSEVLGRKVK